MKKFIIIALAAVFCLAMALPASAEIKLSGMASMDYYIHNQDAMSSPSGFDETDTQFAMWPYTNYIRFTYTNKDATLGATTQFYYGRRNDGLARSPNTTASAGAIWTTDFGNNHIWWKPIPDVKLKMGSQSQFIGTYNGPGILGGIDVICCMITGGSLHTSNKMGFVAEIKINDMVSLKLGAYDPDDDNTPALTTLMSNASTTTTVGTTGWVAADEEQTIPRLDIALPINFGKIQLLPAASWTVRDFDHVAPGYEDSYDQWVVVLGGKATYGPLTLVGEIATGENLGDGNYTGTWTSNARTYVDPAGFTQVADTETTMWFLSLNWKINPQMDLTGFYGQYEDDNDVNPTVADDWALERTNYGLQFIYMLMPNLQIRPSWTHWDHGDDNVYAGGAPTDNGEESVIGIGFLTFF
jgi:hypothetical protein